jgi:hypothetical protein
MLNGNDVRWRVLPVFHLIVLNSFCQTTAFFGRSQPSIVILPGLMDEQLYWVNVANTRPTEDPEQPYSEHGDNHEPQNQVKPSQELWLVIRARPGE